MTTYVPTTSTSLDTLLDMLDDLSQTLPTGSLRPADRMAARYLLDYAASLACDRPGYDQWRVQLLQELAKYGVNADTAQWVARRMSVLMLFTVAAVRHGKV